MKQLSTAIRYEIFQRMYADPTLKKEISILSGEYQVIEKGIQQILEISTQVNVKMKLQKKLLDLRESLEAMNS